MLPIAITWWGEAPEWLVGISEALWWERELVLLGRYGRRAACLCIASTFILFIVTERSPNKGLSLGHTTAPRLGKRFGLAKRSGLITRAAALNF